VPVAAQIIVQLVLFRNKFVVPTNGLTYCIIPWRVFFLLPIRLLSVGASQPGAIPLFNSAPLESIECHYTVQSLRFLCAKQNLIDIVVINNRLAFSLVAIIFHSIIHLNESYSD
jgi:hypothetical protein